MLKSFSGNTRLYSDYGMLAVLRLNSSGAGVFLSFLHGENIQTITNSAYSINPVTGGPDEGGFSR
jgi:hypothetical protein